MLGYFKKVTKLDHHNHHHHDSGKDTTGIASTDNQSVNNSNPMPIILCEQLIDANSNSSNSPKRLLLGSSRAPRCNGSINNSSEPTTTLGDRVIRSRSANNNKKEHHQMINNNWDSCHSDNNNHHNREESNSNDGMGVDTTKCQKRRSLFRRKNFLLSSSSASSASTTTTLALTASSSSTVLQAALNNRKNRRVNSKSSQISSDESSNLTSSTIIVEDSHKNNSNSSTLIPITNGQKQYQTNTATAIIIHPDNNSSTQQQNATFCPTIASALWRPLWPPGWHPRSSSSSTSLSLVQTGGSSGIQQQSANFDVECKKNHHLMDKGHQNHNHHNHRNSNNHHHHQKHSNDNLDSPESKNNKKLIPKYSGNKSSNHQKNINKNNENNYNHISNKIIHNNRKSLQKQLTNGDAMNCDNNDHFNNNFNNDDDEENVVNDDNNQNKFVIFNKEDYERIEDWLDEHPEFTQNYVVRKAPRSLIDKWLLAHSSSMTTVGNANNTNNMMFANQALISMTSQNNENSGGNTPVRKISAHEFEASGGGYLRPMVSTTCDGTLTFLPIHQDSSKKSETNELSYFARNPSTISTLKESLQVGENIYENNNQLDSSSSRECSPSYHLKSRASIISIRSREELESIKDEKELIFELVKDICNDLDVKSLCHKILKNVSILTNADRCSLFLVRGEKDDNNSRYLVSQLFDVCGQSTIEQVCKNEEIIIPWGTGIVGHVAESGMACNIPDCYKDSRFTQTIDQKTGYKTKNMLCNPIFDINGEVMGVAQVINKKHCSSDGGGFNKNDENVFAKYLQFCGIGLRNAQIYERSQLENKRNQVLLDLARMVFEKQSNIENIIYRILIHVLSLLQCERCQIMLLQDDSDDWSLFYCGQSTIQDHCFNNNNNNNQDNTSQLRIQQNSNVVDVSPSSECTSSNASTTSESSSFYDLANNMVDNILNNKSSSTSLLFQQKQQQPKTRSFYRVFDLQSKDLQKPDFERTNKQSPFEGRFPINIGITGYVATTGETLNIPDAYNDNRFDPIVDQNGFRHKSILCMPIRNATRKIIGVAQLVNKLNGRPFNKNDENLFEAFAIFSGMGIENTQMFENAVKAMAKQKVTLELLSYHASANDQEATKFARMLIPSTSSLSLSSLRFDDFSLNEDQMIKACIRMFIDLDLIERFHIDYKVLCKWILSVRKNYRPVLYHNWRHAFNVTQMMFAIFVNTDMCFVLGELETLALVVACLCHDLDHRGTNNSFQIKTSSALAQLYSTSTLEHHHFDQSLMIINSKGNQILKNLSTEEYRRVVQVLEEAILATDLAVYFKKRDQFFELVDNKSYDWTTENHRSLLRSMLMTCCDIAAITKPWETQKVVAELVASEFYHQGDIEKEQLNIEPIDMMNREKREDLPKMQMSFIDTICLPIYEKFAKLYPQKLKILLNGVLANRKAWSLLSNQPYQINITQPQCEQQATTNTNTCSSDNFDNGDDCLNNGQDP